MSTLPGRIRPITPNDSNDFVQGASIYVGVQGDVAVIAEGDTVSQIFKNHPVGYIPCRVKRVLATGTTATNLLALF